MKTICANIPAGIKNRRYKRPVSTVLLFVFMSVSFICCRVISFGQPIQESNKNVAPGDPVNSLKTYIVTGKVTQTYSYCGGAAAPKQLLDKLATPVAYAGKKFYIRAGKTNSIKARIIKSFTTGNNGEFSIRLGPGIYSIIQEEQLYKIKASDYVKQNQQVNEQCLLDWWKKPYYILEVNDNNINQLDFNFHHRCFISQDIPCLEYTGPPVP